MQYRIVRKRKDENTRYFLPVYIFIYIQEEIKRQEVGSKVNKYGKKEKRQ